MFIYVIGWSDAGPCKVGMSKNPEARAAELQAGCPFKLLVLHKSPCRDVRDAYGHEQIFHESHAEQRLVGEWFDLPASLAIDGIKTGFQIADHFAGRDA